MKINKRKYDLVYKKEIQTSIDYDISEQEYFEYYQNMNDPTFENYPYQMKFEVITTDNVSYYETAINLIKNKKNLAMMLTQDFENFIAEWLGLKGWAVHQTGKTHNGCINIVTTKAAENVGLRKNLWVLKKCPLYRPVGARLIRKLARLLTSTNFSKITIVTTGKLTNKALKLIEDNSEALGYIDHEMIEMEFKEVNSDEMVEDLPF